MSLRRNSRNPNQHDGTEAQVVVPPVLPQILLEAVNAETLIVTVNGNKLAATPIRREEISRTVTELVARFACPTRVEVRELDGTVHADILPPPAPQPRSPFAPPEQAAPVVAPPSLCEFTASGFVPGEDVALALVIRHTSADATGTARALVDCGEQPQLVGEIILLGRISRATSVQPIP